MKTKNRGVFLKIHVILNSHLDPVWLWNAAQGIDEVISTAESNCEVLEDYPEAIPLVIELQDIVKEKRPDRPPLRKYKYFIETEKGGAK